MDIDQLMKDQPEFVYPAQSEPRLCEHAQAFVHIPAKTITHSG